MSVRRGLFLLAGIACVLLLMAWRFEAPVFAEAKNQVELTILYTGDEYGYLEPCG